MLERLAVGGPLHLEAGTSEVEERASEIRPGGVRLQSFSPSFPPSPPLPPPPFFIPISLRRTSFQRWSYAGVATCPTIFYLFLPQ